jgi:hypothetical protein
VFGASVLAETATFGDFPAHKELLTVPRGGNCLCLVCVRILRLSGITFGFLANEPIT